eukprot:292402-Pleurochrysis_carterae.AAC.3
MRIASWLSSSYSTESSYKRNIPSVGRAIESAVTVILPALKPYGFVPSKVNTRGGMMVKAA